MYSAKNILGQIGRYFSVPQLVSVTGKRLLLPFYHVVSDDMLPHIAHLYPYRNVTAFEQDLDFLLEHFAPMHLDELLDGGYHGNLQKPAFHLTFDDGLRECSEVIAPILLRKGIPATFFLNSGFIDNKGLFYRYKVSLIIEHLAHNEISTQEIEALHALMPEGAEKLKDTRVISRLLLSLGYGHQFLINQIAEIFGLDFGLFLKEQKPYMGKKEVQQLLDNGFTIGAHSIDHPKFGDLEIIEQLEQTVESLHYIGEVFKVPYRVFAFPFTDDGIGKKYFEEVYETGHAVMDLSFGTAGLKRDVNPRHLQRVAMEGEFDTAEQAVKAAYAKGWMQQSLGMNRIKRS